MAERTPFDRLFNPDNSGTLTGMIGRGFGVQTGAEREGQAKGKALEIFSQLQSQGLTPQQALVQFMKTPEGIDLFTSSPNLDETLKTFATAIQPPEKKMTTVAPGSQLYSTDPATGVTNLIGDNPPQDVQEFKGMQEIAKLPKDELQAIAKAKMLPQNQQAAIKQAAVQRLQRSGSISPETADKLLSGVYQVVQTRDQFGNLTGAMVLDVSTGQAVQSPVDTMTPRTQGQPESSVLGTTGQATAQPTQTPAGPAGTAGSTQAAPQNPDNMWDDKRTMFLGTGLPAKLASSVDTVMRQVNPAIGSETGRQVKSQRQYLNQLYHSFTTIQKDVDSMGYSKAVIDAAKPLMPGLGISEDPLNATANGIKLFDLLQNEKAANLATSKDPRMSIKERERATSRYEGWDRVQRALPTREEMVDLYNAIKSGQAGLSMGDAVRAGTTDVLDNADRLEREGDKAMSGVKTPQGSRIDTMSNSELLKLNPKSLSPTERQALRRRLDAIIQSKPK